jgi:hypothetical protein
MKLDDKTIVGKQINNWTILKFSHKLNYHKYYICRCNICGKEKPVYVQNITSEKSKSCGCEKAKIGLRSKKYNEYYIEDDCVHVKMSNCDDYMLCDIEDWNKLKCYCWSSNQYNYATAYHDGVNILIFHREIFNLENQDIQVDHISGKRLDNRKCNLRLCSNQENSFNKFKNSNNTSGYKGVYFDKERNKWRSVIQINGKSVKSPKRYNTPEEAFEWYRIKSDEYFKTFSVFKSRQCD